METVSLEGTRILLGSGNTDDLAQIKGCLEKAGFIMAGYVPHEFPGRFDEWEKRVHPDDIDAAKTAVSRYLNGDKTIHEIEFRFLRKDGEYMWIRGKGKIVARDQAGNPTRFIGTHSNISKQKRAEEALRNNEQLLSNVFDSMQEGVLVLDSGFRYTTWNRSMEAMSHTPKEEALGTVPWETFPFLRGEIESSMRRAMQGEVCRDIELQCNLVDGKQGWTRESYFPLWDATHNIYGVVGVIEDITDRKRFEKQLQEANDIFNRSPFVVFVWNNGPGWPVRYVSENVRALFGHSAEAFVSGKVSFADAVHADDLDRVAQEVKRNSDQIDRTDFAHEPYRIVTKDGRTKWVSDLTHIRRDSDGGISSYEGILFDITDRKRAEEELKRSVNFTSALLRAVPTPIFYKDNEGLYQGCN